MTGKALQSGVSTGQRELRLAVVEGRGLPGSRTVTIGAKMVKVVRYVIWIGDGREVR